MKSINFNTLRSHHQITWDVYSAVLSDEVNVQSSQVCDLLNGQLQAAQEYKQHDLNNFKLFLIVQLCKAILWSSSSK